MIAATINEDDYRIAGSVAEFVRPGEYGPLDCGCCFVSLGFDPRGPSLVLVMQLKDAEPHPHTLADLRALLADTPEPLTAEAGRPVTQPDGDDGHAMGHT